MSDLQKLHTELENFLAANAPVIIVNTSTDRALLCLDPVLQKETERIYLQFNSLNETGGNSIYVKAIQGSEPATLYVENEQENILMLQALTIQNYAHYIRPQYVDAPETTDLESLKQHLNQIKNA